MKNSKRLLALAVAAACGAPMAAYATNGMNLEGYGPIATGMGGASMAYDNGTAAMMNNPATIGMMADGNRLDVALGVLGPNVDAQFGATKWSSSADSFLMPAVGWTKKSGQLTYGVGAFAQGGMGTEYKNSFMGGPGVAMVAMVANDPTAVAGWKERSEVGVMRILFPLAFNVNDQLSVGGSLDYVRATMDLQMAMPASVMGDMMMNPSSTIGKIVNTIDMSGLPGALEGGYFNFSDNSDYDGKTSGDGFAAKIGFTYKVNSQLTVGGTYHSETSISDLSGNASMEVAFDNGSGGSATMAIPGKIKIKNFQWPATYALGMSFTPSDKWMVAGDVKVINWSAVMKDFRMVFSSAMGDMDATMYQNWKDQTVFQIGAAYQATDAFTVRFGANVSNNPIPNSTVNYLFPATIENHYTAGFGYKVSDAGDVNFSLTYAPEVAVTGTGDANNGLKVTHSQTSWQLMYSHRF